MITTSSFRPASWLQGPHAQTLWPVLFRRGIELSLYPERLELPDGDFLDLLWHGDGAGPVVIILHGLEGSIHSHYARGMMRALAVRGFRTVFMHFRGCSGEPNRLQRGYHSGDTGDLEMLVNTLLARFSGTEILAIGYSLGGNVLLKWLGETGHENPLSAAAAVSVPYDLDACARKLEQGFSRVYQRHLIHRMCSSLNHKIKVRGLPLEHADPGHLGTFRKFDDAVTAPLHGFRGVDDYYARSSCRGFLHGIRVPTLILQAADDPFLPEHMQLREAEISAAVTVELSHHGGHVGFIEGRMPGMPGYWLERRIPDWLHSNISPP